MGETEDCDLCGAQTQVVDVVADVAPGRQPRALRFRRCTSLLCSSNLRDPYDVTSDPLSALRG